MTLACEGRTGAGRPAARRRWLRRWRGVLRVKRPAGCEQRGSGGHLQAPAENRWLAWFDYTESYRSSSGVICVGRFRHRLSRKHRRSARGRTAGCRRAVRDRRRRLRRRPTTLRSDSKTVSYCSRPVVTPRRRSPTCRDLDVRPAISARPGAAGSVTVSEIRARTSAWRARSREQALGPQPSLRSGGRLSVRRGLADRSGESAAALRSRTRRRRRLILACRCRPRSRFADSAGAAMSRHRSRQPHPEARVSRQPPAGPMTVGTTLSWRFCGDDSRGDACGRFTCRGSAALRLCGFGRPARPALSGSASSRTRRPGLCSSISRMASSSSAARPTRTPGGVRNQ